VGVKRRYRGNIADHGFRPDGSKKAYARLTADVDALDIAATKLSIV
jgi:hypothetical protein